MKRATTYGLIVLLAAALISAGALGAAWLGGTTEGARWLMEVVSRHTPLAISARQVEGRLFDRLRLEGVRFSLAPVEVEIERLDTRWQPLLLLAGSIAVKELTLTGVKIRDNTPGETLPDLSWPRVSGIAGVFNGRIDRLQVHGLTYRLLDGQPVNLTALSSSVAWRNALLSLPDLAATAPAGRVAGTIAAGFDRPFLHIDLKAIPATPIAGMDTVSLQGRFLPGLGAEQLAGTLTIAGSSGTVKVLELAGEAGMTGQAFHLRHLRLTAPGRRGSVTGDGTVTPTTGPSLLALHLSAAGLDLAPELSAPTDLSGTLTLTGTSERYRGVFTMANRGKGWQTVHLSGAYQGDGGGVKLAPFTGSLLTGSLQGNIDLRWDKEVSLKGTLQGRNLDPAGIAPDWTGVVNFDLAGAIAWPGFDPPRGEVSVRLLESRLHGQALAGDVRADFAGGDLRITRLLLRGKGFDITAVGDLGKRLSFTAEVGDLSRLIPNTAGEFRAEGWMRWLAGRLDGALTGRGGNLAAGGARIASANMAVRLGEGKDYPVHAAATLRRVTYDRLEADSVTLTADGTALEHTVRAQLQSVGAKALVVLTGAYDQGGWRGKIVDFSGEDKTGPWKLAAPAPLSITAGSITLAPLVLTGVQSERLEVAGEMTREPLGGSVQAVWVALSLSRANQWLPRDVRLEGILAGQAAGKILPGKQLDLSGKISLARGKIRWQKEDGAIDADFPTADLSWGWQGALPASAADIGAGRLVVAGRTLVSGRLKADGRQMNVERGSLSLDGDDHGLRAGMEIGLAGGGMVKGTFSSRAPVRLAVPEAADVTAEWAGVDLALLRPWLPGEVRLDGILAGRVAGKILPGKQLDLSGKISLARGGIHWQKESNAVDADLSTTDFSWRWQGVMPASPADTGAGRLVVAGRTAVSGSLKVDGRQMNVERGSLSLDGDDHGLRAGMEIGLAGGGTLKGRFSSPRAVALVIPTEGEAALEGTGIDLALLRPWLPRAVILEGRLAGRVTGNLLRGQKLSVRGDIALSEGKVRWLRPEGEINLNLRSASVSGDWRGETLRGTVALALAERGQATGSFQLPIPARLPASIDRKVPLQVSLTGHVLEKGLLSSLFPGLIQESSGEIDADVRVGGVWGKPQIGGSLKLTRAGAYLPTAGIHVKDIQLVMHLEKDLVRIDSFRALSGPGHIEGTAQVRLKGWHVAGYRGSIDGERFQIVYFPELQILVSPRLTFEGTPEKLIVRGEVLLPEFLVFGPPTRAVVLPSKDVILEGVPYPAAKTLPLALDVQIRVVLGERVLVKMQGIDAQLGGRIDLTVHDLNRIASKGEIKVAKGRYKAYGVDLEIVRGRLFYTGGPVNQPTLDILALRTISDVRAGITAVGPLQAPVIKLYSEPVMPDVDILAYIVFGHPLSSGSNTTEQATMLAQVAGMLLTGGQSTALQEQIKDRLGLSTFGIQTGSTDAAAGRRGYKEIPASPTGQAPASSVTSASETMLTVGKYLTPKIYLSYGRSLFTGWNLFRLRYDIYKQWQIETQTGSESSLDLYYKIDFN